VFAQDVAVSYTPRFIEGFRRNKLRAAPDLFTARKHYLDFTTLWQTLVVVLTDHLWKRKGCFASFVELELALVCLYLRRLLVHAILHYPIKTLKVSFKTYIS
jgi:hypothetical protein